MSRIYLKCVSVSIFPVMYLMCDLFLQADV